MDAVPLSQPSAFCPEVGLRHLAVTLAVIMPFEREWLPVGWVSLCTANLANPRVLRRFSELAWRAGAAGAKQARLNADQQRMALIHADWPQAAMQAAGRTES
jgi:hypothetical protein